MPNAHETLCYAQRGEPNPEITKSHVIHLFPKYMGKLHFPDTFGECLLSWGHMTGFYLIGQGTNDARYSQPWP